MTDTRHRQRVAAGGDPHQGPYCITGEKDETRSTGREGGEKSFSTPAHDPPLSQAPDERRSDQLGKDSSGALSSPVERTRQRMAACGTTTYFSASNFISTASLRVKIA